MQIQRLTGNNVLELRELNEVFAEAFEDKETHLTKLPTDDYLHKLLSKEHVIALAASSDQKVIGGLIAYVFEKYEQERSEIYIYDLAVDKNFRRQGIARALIDHLKKVAKEMGAWMIFVQADRVDTPAVMLYESLGTREEPLHFDISPE